MKYLTKEWYDTMQKTGLHLLLKVSKKAEVFSEEFFRELYEREENKWLNLQKEVSELRFEDVYPEEFYAEYADGTPLEVSEFDKAKQAYLEERKRAKLNFDNIASFDPEKEREAFKLSFRDNIKVLKVKLPEEILQKVADIRVLALDYASAEVKKEVTQFCKKNERIVRSTMDAYQKQYNKQFKSFAPSFASELALHDCRVLSCRKRGNDIVLTIDNSGGFTDIKKIIMKNCSVIKQDALLYDAWFLYEEIYKTGKWYEIHFLLDKNKLIDFIVTVDDLEYLYEH